MIGIARFRARIVGFVSWVSMVCMALVSFLSIIVERTSSLVALSFSFMSNSISSPIFPIPFVIELMFSASSSGSFSYGEGECRFFPFFLACVSEYSATYALILRMCNFNSLLMISFFSALSEISIFSVTTISLSCSEVSLFSSSVFVTIMGLVLDSCFFLEKCCV